MHLRIGKPNASVAPQTSGSTFQYPMAWTTITSRTYPAPTQCSRRNIPGRNGVSTNMHSCATYLPRLPLHMQHHAPAVVHWLAWMIRSTDCGSLISITHQSIRLRSLPVSFGQITAFALRSSMPRIIHIVGETRNLPTIERADLLQGNGRVAISANRLLPTMIASCFVP